MSMLSIVNTSANTNFYKAHRIISQAIFKAIDDIQGNR